MKQAMRNDSLDGLRALAVSGVLVTHWAPLEGFSPGRIGVDVFFVLSGYLVTRVLLRGGTFARFAYRRALRIVPLYVLTVALAALVYPQVRESLVYHLTYTTNLQRVTLGVWSGLDVHLWSLSVEEQWWYLVGAPLVLLAPRSWLRPALWVFVVGAPLLRWGLLEALPPVSVRVWPMAYADTFAAGALLLSSTPGGRLRVALRSRAFLGVAVVAVYLCYGTAVDGTASALLGVTLILACEDGQMRWLEAPPLVWLGQRSYAVYLIHLFVTPVGLWAAAGLAEHPAQVFAICVNLAVTLALAEASWRLVEEPIMRRRGRGV
jgi:peptidoglycan/LPS O-acetylase OafA/YrhL